MRKANLTRRHLAAMAAAPVLLSLGAKADRGARTPAQTAGPFYPPPADRVADEDTDLVRIAGRVRDAGGEILHLSGRVLGLDGRPSPEALIEIWQCDVNGRYRHSGDWSVRRRRDRDFQGYGWMRTDTAGAYAFRTIRPAPYPGRTPHIHARISPGTGAALTTQIYMSDERANLDDGIFLSLSETDRMAAMATPERRSDSDWRATFDFIL